MHSHLISRSDTLPSLWAGFSPALRGLPTFHLGLSRQAGLPVAPRLAPTTCPVSPGSMLSIPGVPEGRMGGWGGLAGDPGGGLRSHLYANTLWDLRKTPPQAERPLLSSASGAATGQEADFRVPPALRSQPAPSPRSRT